MADENVMTPSDKLRCRACGFQIFNRRFPKCESCGAPLPSELLYTRAELDTLEAEDAKQQEALTAARKPRRKRRTGGDGGGYSGGWDGGGGDGGGCGGGD